MSEGSWVKKWTPGAWVYYAGTRSIYTADSVERSICVVCGPRKTEEPYMLANANLIAAAPRLVEALEALVQGLTTEEFDHDEMCIRLRKAKSALAAAYGEERMD